MASSEGELSDIELDNALEEAFEAQTAKGSGVQEQSVSVIDMQPSGAARPSWSMQLDSASVRLQKDSRLRGFAVFGQSESADVLRQPQSKQSFRKEGGAERAFIDSTSFWAIESDAAGSSRLPLPSASQISFHFPDWGVDFSRGKVKPATQNTGQVQSAPRTQSGGGWSSEKKLTTLEEEKGLSMGQDPSVPGLDCYFHSLPDEVLWSIFGRLSHARDICNCSFVCVRWEELLNGDEIWARLLAERFEGQKWSPGGAKMAFKMSTMVQNVARRFQILKKGFEYLAAALDAWWDSPPASDPQLPYSLVTVRRILGKLTASNWALLYEGLQALFIARADKLALELLIFLTEAQASRPQHQPSSRAPSSQKSTRQVASLGDSTALQKASPNGASKSQSLGSFSDDLLEAFGRSPSKRHRKAFQTVSHVINQTVPISELVARAESEPDGQGWGRGLRVLAEAGANPDDVAEALASGAVYDTVGSERKAEPLPPNYKGSELNIGNFLRSIDQLEGREASANSSRSPELERGSNGILQEHVEQESASEQARAEVEEEGHVQKKSGTTRVGRIFEERRGLGLNGRSGAGRSRAEEQRSIELEREESAPSSIGRTRVGEHKEVGLEREKSTPVAIGRTRRGAIGRTRMGAIGAALWREVLKVWRRQRAFVLLVSEQCESLNVEVLRERSRSLGIAATPTVFDQGALCFRGQILLRHKLRRPLQAGLAWLTMRAISGDATDEEYALLLNIKHMRQEIDVSDDFTLTKATFTQAKFRRCFTV